VRTGKKVFFHEDLNLKGLTKRNQVKQDENGRAARVSPEVASGACPARQYLPNGQSAKSGLNLSWADAAFANFFTILGHIAGKAGAVVIGKNPAYTSQVLSYRDEIIFTDCSIRDYWDDQENLCVDRDINAAINIKRVGLEMFPTIKRRKGSIVIELSVTDNTSKEAIHILRNI
jgi:putative transposase